MAQQSVNGNWRAGTRRNNHGEAEFVLYGQGGVSTTYFDDGRTSIVDGASELELEIKGDQIGVTDDWARKLSLYRVTQSGIELPDTWASMHWYEKEAWCKQLGYINKYGEVTI